MTAGQGKLGKFFCSTKWMKCGVNGFVKTWQSPCRARSKSTAPVLCLCPRRLSERAVCTVTQQLHGKDLTQFSVSQPPKLQFHELPGWLSYDCQIAFHDLEPRFHPQSWNGCFAVISTRVRGVPQQTWSCYRPDYGCVGPTLVDFGKLTGSHVWSLFLKHYGHPHLDFVRNSVSHTNSWHPWHTLHVDLEIVWNRMRWP